MTFADAPVSLAEVRAEKQEDGRLWSPRDALINLLREIDKGEVEPVDIVISYREVTESGQSQTRFVCAGPGGCVVALGMMARTAFRMQEQD